MDELHELLQQLSERRKTLKMSWAAVAARSGLPLSTVKRLLSSKPRSPQFTHVAALARALGASLRLDQAPEDQVVEQQARKQATRLVGMVQGTMGLEHQAVPPPALQMLIEESVARLRSGPRKRLWAEP
jgi:transcriptional regulator with XRE-family HTH domain